MTSVLPKALRQRLRWMIEACGIERYSMPGLNGLDRRLLEYLPNGPGFFVEAGANDGFSQSNTYFLSRFRGWQGLLIEPVRAMYDECLVERPESTVFNCALVADPAQTQVTMHVAGLMSLVEGAQRSPDADRRHALKGSIYTGTPVRSIEVPGRTLSSLLDEARAPQVDLLVLDVEGYELQALRGLDLSRHRPTFILVEAWFEQEIDGYLSDYYRKVEYLSHHDVLYKLNNEDSLTAPSSSRRYEPSGLTGIGSVDHRKRRSRSARNCELPESCHQACCDLWPSHIISRVRQYWIGQLPTD